MELLRRGVRFRIGHVMLLISYSGLVFALVDSLFRSREFQHRYMRAIVIALAIFVQPHLFRLFLLYLGQPGPLRAWFAVCCRMLSDLVLGGIAATNVLIRANMGITTGWNSQFSALIAGFCLSKFFWMLAVSLPRCCPICRRHTFLPLVQLRQFLDGLRAHSRFCVSCGYRLVRAENGSWQAPVEPDVVSWLGGLGTADRVSVSPRIEPSNIR
jgi:hypothetical protein